jgi:hypothetical protein
MSKRVTLFSQEQSTMLSTWTTEIIGKSARGGSCALETNVTGRDLSEDQDDYFEFCSEPIKTKQDFLSAWHECCDLMSIDAEVDGEVIANLETICPQVAKELRASCAKEGL